MNKNLFIAMLISSSVLVAQDLNAINEPVAPAAPVASYTAPSASTYSAPAKEVDLKANMNKLRGNSYGHVAHGNSAAAFTVSDYMALPHLWANQSVLYFEPTQSTGVAVFPMSGESVILGFRDVNGNGVTTMGLASGKMGLTLELGLDLNSETIEKTAEKSTETTSEVNAGTYYSLNFSMDMNGNSFSADLGITTEMDETDTDVVDETYKDYSALFSYGNFHTDSKLFWNGTFGFIRHTRTKDEIKEKKHVLTVDGSTDLNLGFNIGTEVASNERARAFLGLTQGLDVTMFDDITNNVASKMSIDLKIRPTVTAEFAIDENWSTFAGATHELVIGLTSQDDMAGTTTETQAGSTSSHTEKTSGTIANAGIRYDYEGLSLEASLQNSLFTDGFAAVFNKGNVIGSFSAMLNF